MLSLGDTRETISLYWSSAVSLLAERLHSSPCLCSFRVKVLLTTVTVLLFIFAAIGFIVLYHQDACLSVSEQTGTRVEKKTRSTQKSHQLVTTTKRKSKIIEAITTTTRMRPSFRSLKPTIKSGRHTKTPGLINILRFETTTTAKPDYEKNAGLLLHYRTTSALQLPKLTDPSLYYHFTITIIIIIMICLSATFTSHHRLNLFHPHLFVEVSYKTNATYINI